MKEHCIENDINQILEQNEAKRDKDEGEEGGEEDGEIEERGELEEKMAESSLESTQVQDQNMFVLTQVLLSSLVEVTSPLSYLLYITFLQ